MAGAQERTMEFNRIKIEPLSATIGAEVKGVDLTKLDDTTFDQVMRHSPPSPSALLSRPRSSRANSIFLLKAAFLSPYSGPNVSSPEGYPAIMRIHVDVKLRPLILISSRLASVQF